MGHPYEKELLLVTHLLLLVTILGVLAPEHYNSKISVEISNNRPSALASLIKRKRKEISSNFLSWVLCPLTPSQNTISIIQLLVT